MNKIAFYQTEQQALEASFSFKGPQIVARFAELWPNGQGWGILLVFNNGITSAVTTTLVDSVVS